MIEVAELNEIMDLLIPLGWTLCLGAAIGGLGALIVHWDKREKEDKEERKRTVVLYCIVLWLGCSLWVWGEWQVGEALLLLAKFLLG